MILVQESRRKPGRCPVDVTGPYEYHTRSCERPVKGALTEGTLAGTEVCGLHVAFERKAKEHRAEREAERARALNDRAAADRDVATLKAQGLEARAQFYGGGYYKFYEGDVIVSAEELIALLEKAAGK